MADDTAEQVSPSSSGISLTKATSLDAAAGAAPEASPTPIVFHIRHFGVGGVEAALLGWLRGLDRRRFAPSLSVFLPTREWETVWRQRVPADVPVHVAVPAQTAVTRLHQARRDGRLGKVGRLMLAWQLRRAEKRWLRPQLERLQQSQQVLIDFDHTLRKWVSQLHMPAIAVRQFAFWGRRTAKARRVGRDLAAYQRVVVLNEAMQQQAEALYGPPGPAAPRCVVVPNLFDLEALRAAAAEPIPQGVLPALPDTWAVCVARLDIRTKGLDTLLEAWQQLVAQLPEARLLIVGGGGDEAMLQQMIVNQGLQPHVFLLGMQPNPHPWIARARLLVLTSRSEGSPNVLIEGLAHGTPIVATDCPVGPAHILQNGHCGALVPVDDVPALVEALARGWQDAAWGATMKRRGLERANDFGVERGNERFAALIGDVLHEAEQAKRR